MLYGYLNIRMLQAMIFGIPHIFRVFMWSFGPLCSPEFPGLAVVPRAAEFPVQFLELMSDNDVDLQGAVAIASSIGR